MGKKSWADQHQETINKYNEEDRERKRKYYQNKREKIIDQNKRRYRKLRYELYMELGGKCLFCDKEDIGDINFHHTVPMMVYESKIYHYKRNIDIIVPLCRKCHEQLHWVNDWLGIDDIFKP